MFGYLAEACSIHLKSYVEEWVMVSKIGGDNVLDSVTRESQAGKSLEPILAVREFLLDSILETSESLYYNDTHLGNLRWTVEERNR